MYYTKPKTDIEAIRWAYRWIAGEVDSVPSFTCGNLSYDSDDKVLYSYGKHYPLMFMVDNHAWESMVFVNTHWYSATTTKHIGLCDWLLKHGVDLPSKVWWWSYSAKHPTYYSVKEWLEGMMINLWVEFEWCARQWTKKVQGILHQLDRVEELYEWFVWERWWEVSEVKRRWALWHDDC